MQQPPNPPTWRPQNQPQRTAPGYYQYSKGLLLTLCIAFAALWVVVAPLASMTAGTGFADFIGKLASSTLWGILATVLILDWRGYTSLRGAIHWRNMTDGWRIAAIIGFCLVFYVMLGIYLVRAVLAFRRAAQVPQPVLATATPMPPARTAARSTAVGVASLLLVTACALITYSSVGAQQGAAADTSGQQGQTVQAQATNTSTSFTTTAVSTDTPIPTATATPKPTATPTPKPTYTPSPAAPAQPTCIPGAVNCNPWGFNFDHGNYIYYPPSGFCGYFNCINNFPNGNGYVMQCQDGMYSKSGGISGSCSKHGGNSRPLYQP